MADLEVKHPHQSLDFILTEIADWVTRYRNARRARDDLAQCTPEDVVSIANECGVSVQELSSLATKSENSAALLEKMLVALGVNATAHDDAAVMHDLQRLCVNCGQKKRCSHDISVGTAAESFRQFCPNAYTLDALLTDKGVRRLRRDR